MRLCGQVTPFFSFPKRRFSTGIMKGGVIPFLEDWRVTRVIEPFPQTKKPVKFWLIAWWLSLKWKEVSIFLFLNPPFLLTFW